MKINREDLTRHYAGLSDNALLSLDPAELVDAAREVYEQELFTRSLGPEHIVAVEEPDVEAEIESGHEGCAHHRSTPDKNAEIVELWLTDILKQHAATIEDMLAEEDVVAARLTIDGRQGFCFARVDHGAVAETWNNFDTLGLKRP